MNIFKKLFMGLGGLILALLGLSIVLKQVFGIVTPALSTLLEIFGGLILIWVGFLLLQTLFKKH